MVRQYQLITAALVLGCMLWLLAKTWAFDRRRNGFIHPFLDIISVCCKSENTVCNSMIIILCQSRKGCECQYKHQHPV